MEEDEISSSALAETLRLCIDSYIDVVKAYAADTSGMVESLALDGIHLAFWARIIGLRAGELDPQLHRFRSYIHHELRALWRVLGGSLAGNAADRTGL